jgi:hypothetical protein
LTVTPNHGLSTNSLIAFFTTGALPTPLVADKVYYAIVTAVNKLKVALKPNGPAITLGATGANSSVTFAYEPGDMVSYLGNNYYCFRRPWFGIAPVQPPTVAAYWYPLPVAPNIYEIPNSYTEADLFDIKTTQSFDVMTLTHQAYPIAELRRYGLERWVFSAITLAPKLPAPQSVDVTGVRGAALVIMNVTAFNPATLQTPTFHHFAPDDPVYVFGMTGTGSFSLPDGHYIVDTVPTTNTFTLKTVADGTVVTCGAVTYTASSGHAQFASLSSETLNEYVVTAVSADGSESEASGSASELNNLFVSGSKNVITWAAVTDAIRYRIYKRQSSLYGFIGQTDNSVPSFDDDNIGPDLGTSPPILDTSLNGSDHPGAVGYFEQRRVFAGSLLEPQKVWLTKSGTESDLAYALPVQDSDRIAFRVAARQNGTIRHVVPLQHLLLLSSSAEYRVTPINSDALTPASVSVRPQGYTGASHVAPLIVNTTIVFCADRGGHVREMGWNPNADGFATGDLSLRAAHLFDTFEIRDSAYAKAPSPILWFVSTSGKLLGLTYIPEERVGGWHAHETDGLFESVAAVTEGGEDRVYAVVNRAGVRFVERMASQTITTLAGACAVDASVTYSGAPVPAVPGLAHLNGRTVQILADGLVQPPRLVSGGVVILDAPASLVHVGLAYTSTLRTLPLVLQGVDSAAGQGRTKNVNRLRVRASKADQFFVGPSVTDLVPAFDAGVLQEGEVPVTLPGGWSDGGQLTIVQANPVPLTVVGLTLEVAIGG